MTCLRTSRGTVSRVHWGPFYTRRRDSLGHRYTHTHKHTHTHDQDLRERATVGGVARAKALSASNDEVNAPRDDAFCLGGSEIRWRSPPPADAGTTAEDDGELEKWGAGDEVAGELREVCFAAPSPNDL
mmetsp:Transcript_58580/g.94630  ORF Transcript_58580/g.94630 Transcript_58580/m.94630 type:complete len:129 (-) Transcript_58580:36-422(-)